MASLLLARPIVPGLFLLIVGDRVGRLRSVVVTQSQMAAHRCAEAGEDVMAAYVAHLAGERIVPPLEADALVVDRQRHTVVPAGLGRGPADIGRLLRDLAEAHDDERPVRVHLLAPQAAVCEAYELRLSPYRLTTHGQCYELWVAFDVITGEWLRHVPAAAQRLGVRRPAGRAVEGDSDGG